MYLPSIGLFLLAGLAVAWAWTKAAAVQQRGRTASVFFIVMVAVFVVFLSYRTSRLVAIWEDSESLWSYVIEKEPRKIPLSYSNRGLVFQERGLVDRAIEDFSAAIVIDPQYASAYINRGVAFLQKGEFNRAIEDFNRALAVQPDYDIYIDRGNTFYKKGEFDRALEDYHTAIAIKPDSYQAYINRGNLNMTQGEFNRAIEDYTRALSLNVDFVKGYISRGDVYVKTGDRELALKDYWKACDMGSEVGCSKALALKSK
jgi:tetratricopeptide (TPR) repeat protein